ncbi:MAG: NIPSNAP family protein [Tissierellales bacterium]
MYMLATLKLSYAGVGTFLAIAPKVKAIVEKEGWVLEKALISQASRLNTVTHLWKIRDMNHYHEGLEKIQVHPDFPEILAALSASVDEEIISFGVDTPYS